MDANRLLAAFCAALIFAASALAQFQPSRSPNDLVRAGQNVSKVPVRVTKNPNFGIPFEIAKTSSDVSEVQLHVSTDQGRNWQLYQKQQPGADGFQFRATSDGEYLFAVRTIGRGQDNRDQLQPELKVIVDRQLPKLNIRVLSSPTGQATVDWLAQDDNLDASSFRIQYQNQDAEWQDVPFTKLSEQDKRTEWQSQAQWSMRTRGSEVAVRAEVFDRAGNSTVASKRISIERNGSNDLGGDKVAHDSWANARNNGSDTPVGQSWDDLTAGIRKRLSPLLGDVQHTDNTFGASSPQNWADREPTTGGLADVSDRFERQSISRSVSAATDQLRTQPESQSNSRFEPNFQQQEPTFADRPQTSEFDQRSDPQFTNRRDVRNQAPNFDRSGNRSGNRRYATDRPANLPSRGFADNQETFRPTQQDRFRDAWPPERNRVDEPVSQQRPQGPAADSSQRMFRPRITASPNFELVYDLYGVSANDQRQVELWFTRDRGRSWELFGRDGDGQSPVEVRLRSEGLFGFQLIVDSGRGQAPQPPQAGDDPDVWVIVDWTKPIAQISRVEMPHGPDSREITIEWTANDAASLAEAPITLSYSGNPNGPWTPIAQDIANAGAYYWRVDRRLPERLYIQMEARDMAGNVTADIYDGSGGPSGRIRDVRPIVR